jgi:hypothetical protein
MIAHRKFLFAVPFLLIYLVLYFAPWTYSFRFGVGLFFPFIILVVLVLLKIVHQPYSLMKRVYLSVLLSIIVFSLLFFVLILILPYSYTMLVQDAEIRGTVNKMTAGLPDQELKVREIIDWEKKNIIGMYGDEPDFGGFYFISEFPFIWIRNSDDPSWIFFYERGMCKEYAVLFEKMAGFAGVQSRQIYNPAEDHEWVEVWIDNSWKHVDPSENIFDNPGVYENVWGKQLSYVYTFDNEGNEVDVTNRYTRTGKLIVHVEKDGLLIENVKIVVKSRFLMENYPWKYNSPRVAKENNTDQSGTCMFNLGGNNYTIEAELDGFRDERIINLKEDDETNITLILH